MQNAWKVIWTMDGHKKLRRFESESPSPAIEFGKGIKRGGGTDVAVVSCRKAFHPPKGQERPAGGVWCPYCVKWRGFKEIAIQREGYTTAAILRCPVCSISIHDAYVREFNFELSVHYQVQQEHRRDVRRKR